MSPRGIARPGRPAASPLSRQQQAIILPVVKQLAAEGLTDGAISARLTSDGPLAATLAQVCRLRQRNGIKSLNDHGGDRRPAVVLADGVRQRYIDRVQQMAADGMPDREIAAVLGLSKSQISTLRWTYEIPPGLGQRRPQLTLVPSPDGKAARPRSGKPPRRIKDPEDVFAICNYCVQPVSAFFDDTAAKHNRLIPRGAGLGGLVPVECKGTSRLVRWEPIREEWRWAA